MKDPDAEWEQGVKDRRIVVHPHMAPETRVALENLKEDIRGLKEDWSKMYSNFDGKVNMMVRLVSDVQDKNDKKFVQKELLDEMMRGLHDAIDSMHKTQKASLEQQKLTNGRIGVLETWRTAIVAGGTVALAFVTFFGDKIRQLF